jgi:hypothetical protein
MSHFDGPLTRRKMKALNFAYIFLFSSLPNVKSTDRKESEGYSSFLP